MNVTLSPPYAVVIYLNDVVVLRTSGKNNRVPPKRGPCEYWSDDSRKGLAFVAANTAVQFRYMVTLTYPSEYPGDGATSKQHLNKFLNWLRLRCKRAGVSLEYLWFFEFQARGAPHYHLLLDCNLPDIATRKEVSQSWYRVVGSNDTKHLKAGTRCERLRSADGGKHYAVKYGQKMKQKRVPEGYQKVGRFWGNSRGVTPDPIAWARVDSYDDVRELVKGWEYEDSIKDKELTVLYNAAGEAASNAAGSGNWVPKWVYHMHLLKRRR